MIAQCEDSGQPGRIAWASAQADQSICSAPNGNRGFTFSMQTLSAPIGPK